jgi:hypothetical protein
MPSIFPQNVIALIWDFDKTLIPGYMQDPMFEHFGVDGDVFWREANGLADSYRELGAEVVAETQYLNHILAYARHGKFQGLSNKRLQEFGERLPFFPGMPEALQRLKGLVIEDERYAKHEISLEHYVVSTGLRQIILGSSVAPHLDGVWGCELVEQVPLPGFLNRDGGPLPVEDMLAIANVIDDTTKTRAVFEINKGTNKVPDITVNSSIPHEERRVPFQNMIYVADGPSDIPVFSVVKQFDGRTYGVFDPSSEASFDQVNSLLEDGRVDAVGAADYRRSTPTDMWLARAIRQIADGIVEAREQAVGARARKPPRYLLDPPPERDDADAPAEFGLPRKAVPQLVEDLLQRAGITGAPILLEPILAELHIEISAREQQEEEAVLVAMTDPTDGAPKAWMVYYNPARPENRRRFTVAHEIGHVMLHGAPNNLAVSARGGGGRFKAREREADGFAAELLIPRAFLRAAVDELGVDVDALRRRFRVSAEAMRRRLEELGY